MSAQPQATILYVDDDETHRRALGWIFRSAGFAVKEAGSGREALRLMEDHPDLVILDVNLPDINGFEVCRRIKSHPGTRSTPVLHLSGMFIRSEDRTHGLEGGADGYLTKPVEPQEVLATVKALLRVRQAEEAARAAARQWQATFDAISDPLCLLDGAGEVVRGNAALADLLRRPLAVVVGRPLQDLVLEVLGPVEDGFFDRARRTGSREVVELPLAGRWYLAAGDPVRDDEGRVVGSVHHFSDITDRKRGEEERTRLLAEHGRLAEKLRLLLESTGEGIFGLDREGCCTFVNRAAAQMLGRKPEELVAKDLHALTHHSHPDGTPYAHEFCPVRRTLETGEGCRVDREVFWRPDGTSFPVEYSAHPIRDGGAIRGTVVAFVDATERNRLEQQVRQAQKMDAIGRLAGGVAHDFNNLLTAITGNLSLLLSQTRATDPCYELLKAADTAAWRAAELVRQLLGFSRQSVLWLQPCHLGNCIQEVVAILRRTMDPRIRIEVRPPAADLWLVQADAGQMNQVLLNLCLNARDAMPDGGQLTFETDNLALDAVEAGHNGTLDARPGEFVRLRVRDTGHGIPAEILPRIFDPYFTTKEAGKGTGLGLAMVFGIVKQHQGWIVCRSEPGQGACFEVYLPRYRGGPAADAPAGPAAPAGGSETVLLVDDNPLIRDVGRLILESYGYRVLLAEDGARALEVYRQEAKRIDLVILDLTMPQLSGRDVLQGLIQINPEVRVLFASGYSPDLGSGPGMERVQGFIHKPYREQDLAKTVRAVFDRAKPGG